MDLNLQAQNAGKFDFTNLSSQNSFLNAPLGNNLTFKDISGQSSQPQTLSYQNVSPLRPVQDRTVEITGLRQIQDSAVQTQPINTISFGLVDAKQTAESRNLTLPSLNQPLSSTQPIQDLKT